MTAYSKRRKDIIQQLEAETIELMSAFMNAETAQDRIAAYHDLNSISKMIAIIERIDRQLNKFDKSETPEDFIFMDVETR